MTRQPSDINPNDVFPPSNLPGSAQAWGRVVEDREVALEKGYIAHSQSIDGLNRTLSSSNSTIAGQLNGLTATQAQLTAKVQTYRRVLLHSELVTTGYPAPNVSFPCLAPTWATSGVVLAYTFPAWTGTLTTGQEATMIALPWSTWNGNSPGEAATAKIYYETGWGGSTRLSVFEGHRHPVEVKGTPGFPTGSLLVDMWWGRTASFPASGVSLTVDTTILWN